MEPVFLVIFVLVPFVLGMYFDRLLIRHKKHSNEGVIRVKEEDDGRKVFSLELDVDPDDIEHMKQVSFKVIGTNGST